MEVEEYAEIWDMQEPNSEVTYGHEIQNMVFSKNTFVVGVKRIAKPLKCGLMTIKE
jgi:hypothetical protein